MCPALGLDNSLLRPGLRLAVGLSGGADSVALLRALAARSAELGLVLHAAHLHHGLRGAEADGDLEFCRELAAKLGLPFHEARIDTAAAARPDPKSGKPAETIEEAARRLRYSWFRQLLSKSPPHAVVDAVATAHTFDDQAETVLAKFLRGAWTEGLSGIHPTLECPEGGRVIRPLLFVRRVEIEAYLRELGQDWREDASNRNLTFTRNRIRHELLPLLESWNPRLREHLAQMAALAREEEAWWQAELARVAPQTLLPGRPVRGGGRAAGGGSAASLALEVTRMAAIAPALQRRLIRRAAQQFGAALDFAATEAIRSMALTGRAGQKLELAQGLRAERTARELRLSVAPQSTPGQASGPKGNGAQVQGHSVQLPGEIVSPAFGLRLRIDVTSPGPGNEDTRTQNGSPPHWATLRNWKPGDRVRLRYSGSPRKVKEVLERLHVTGSERALWPVLEIDGRVVWMRGVELEPASGLVVTVIPTDFAADFGPQTGLVARPSPRDSPPFQNPQKSSAKIAAATVKSTPH